MKYIYAALTALSILVSAAYGEPSSVRIPSGHYILSGDSGTLEIKTDVSGRRHFAIETVGGNCHTCSLSGVILGTTGYSGEEGKPGEEVCKVGFKRIGAAAVDVKPLTPETCRDYCGMRAGFDGTYKVPPASCSRKTQQMRRDEFQRLYWTQQFALAAEKLSGLLKECGDFINWIEIDKARNDLSLAQFHGGDASACLKTLSETYAGQSSKEEDFYLPPCDRDNYQSVATATWHNRSLCEKAMAGHK